MHVKENCPHCGLDLKGDPIPHIFAEHYGNQKYYSRKIGRYDVETDRVVEWICPECKGTWPRDLLLLPRPI